jgi:hypothetical protein
MEQRIASVSPVAFARLAWGVGSVAREHGLVVPGFRDAPPGVSRHLRRRSGREPVVVVVVQGQTEADVRRDLVDGVLAVNRTADPLLVSQFCRHVGVASPAALAA